MHITFSLLFDEGCSLDAVDVLGAGVRPVHAVQVVVEGQLGVARAEERGLLVEVSFDPVADIAR